MAPSQPQVIYIVESSPRQTINEVYKAKKATVLGWIHIFCGVVILTAEITSPRLERYFLGTGIWTSIIFFTSGILAICGARNKNKRLVTATLVMSVLSAVSAGVLLILTCVIGSRDIYDCSYYSDGYKVYVNDYTGGYSNGYNNYKVYNNCSLAALQVTFSLEIMASLVMLVAGVTSASLTCRPLCCRPFLAPIPTPAPAPTPALLLEDLPPAYGNCAKKFPQLQQGDMC